MNRYKTKPTNATILLRNRVTVKRQEQEPEPEPEI